MSKKVAFISSDAKTFGLFRKDLAETILKSGHQVHIIIPYQNDQKQIQYLESLVKAGAKLHHINCSNTAVNPIGDIKLFCRLLMLIGKIRPEVSFCYFIKPVIYGTLASRLMGVEHVCALVSGVGYIFTSTTLKAKTLRFFITRLYRYSLRYSDKILFQNTENMHFISKVVGNIKSKCSIVDGSGVNMQIYKKSKASGEQQASFVFTGRLLKDKGVSEYIQAANTLKKIHGGRFHATLIGGQHPSPDCLTPADIEQLNHHGAVNILGEKSQRELIAIYQNCNVFVLPSYYGEGIPRSILEAMSMRMAIITTNWPGCKETVIEGKNGMLIGIKSVEELVCAMKKLILRPEIIPLYGTESFNMARERFEINRVNKQYLKHMKITANI